MEKLCERVLRDMKTEAPKLDRFMSFYNPASPQRKRQRQRAKVGANEHLPLKRAK